MQILLWFMVDMLIRYYNFVIFVIVGSEIYILLLLLPHIAIDELLTGLIIHRMQKLGEFF